MQYNLNIKNPNMECLISRIKLNKNKKKIDNDINNKSLEQNIELSNQILKA